MEESWTDGIVTHYYTEDGEHVTECDEDFTPAEIEDWDETKRRPRFRERLLRMRRME